MNLIRLNVGGTIFTTSHSTLRTAPYTKLSRLNTSLEEYDSKQEVYFFDRNSRAFEGILDYYRTGELHFPKDICGSVIKRELEFWEIPMTAVSDCCFGNVCDYDDMMKNMTSLRSTFENQDMQFSKDDLQRNSLNRIRDFIWRFLNYPKSSKPALIYTVVYLLFLIVPVLTFIFGTHPNFREEYPTPLIPVTYANETWWLTFEQYMFVLTGNPKLAKLSTTTPKKGIIYTEGVCAVFFGIEVLTRVFCCPRKLHLLKCPLQYIDLIVLFSSLIAFGIEIDFSYEEHFEMYLACKALVILRTVRMIHLTRHIGGLRVLVLAIRASVKELFLLLLSFLSVAIFFAAVIFYAEFFQPDTFENMPIALWWSIVTMTTVGYGDFTPSTFVGYTFGSVCAIIGVLIISMPVAVITANFSALYNLNKIRTSKHFYSETTEETVGRVVHKNNKISCITKIG